jgi:hypothetical protein
MSSPKVIIGVSDRKNIGFDLDILLRTRLLIQANSGGGKSWLLRRIAEQAFGKVQVIIIDPEGEFSTLREKLDYVLVGKGGETPADVRSAGLVAHKLLELNASAVCDLYEMKSSQRHEWVKLFLDALLDAPKNLWHPLLVIVDEAHSYCPEKGAGESIASDAMIGLATRGRKRGYCAIFATQRLGKLRKDAAAELTNVMVGQTFIDIDRKRAAEMLGIPHSDERLFFDEMKVIEPGNFYALGRAITKERILVKIGPVTTTHPEPGQAGFIAEPPPIPEKIKSLLPKLSDLPREAEQKARTESELRQEITSLRHQLSARPTVAVPETKIERVEIPILQDSELSRLEEIASHFDEDAARLTDAARNIYASVKAYRSAPQIRFTAPPARMISIKNRPLSSSSDSGEKLQKAERSILIVLAQYPEGRSVNQIAILAGYAVGTGGFNNALGALRSKRFIVGSKEMTQITQAGINALGEFSPLPVGQELREYWRRKLGKAERAAFDVLIEVWPNSVDRDELASQAGYTPGTGGINNAMSRLKTLELAVQDGVKSLKANDNLMEVE